MIYGFPYLAEWVGFEPTVPKGTTDFEGREADKTPYISAQVRIKSLLQACKNGIFSYLVICVRITLQLHFSRPGTIWAPRAPFGHHGHHSEQGGHMNNNILLDKGIILSSGEISKDKINLVAGAITQPFAEMVWVTTGGDMETINRLTDILVSMNTPADRGKLFKIIKMLYGLMGLQFSEEAEPMGADPAVLEYFIFSFTADFGEIIKDYIAEIE